MEVKAVDRVQPQRLFGFVCISREDIQQSSHAGPNHLHILSEIIMQPSLIRRQLGGIVPPKVASPTLLVRFKNSPWKNPSALTTRVFWFSSVQTGGSGGSLTPLVNFYSKLPKGPTAQSSFGGLKARYFSGKNASAAPILATILGIFTVGYTIDYQSAYRYPRLPPCSN